MVPACASGGNSIDGFGIRLRVRGSSVSMKPVSRKSPLPAMRQEIPTVGSAKENTRLHPPLWREEPPAVGWGKETPPLHPPLWREKLAIGALVASSFGMRGTDTGGRAASF